MSDNALNLDQTTVNAQLIDWGLALAHARTKAGLSESEVARKLGLSKVQIQALELGSDKPFHNAFFHRQAIQKYQTLFELAFDLSILEAVTESAHLITATSTPQTVSQKSPLASPLASPHALVGSRGLLSNAHLMSSHAKSTKPKIIALSVLVLAASAALLWALMPLSTPSQDSPTRVSPTTEVSVSSPIAAPTPPISSLPKPVENLAQASPTSPIPSSAPAAPVVSNMTSATQTASPIASKPNTTDNAVLNMTFTQDCWVQALSKDGVTLEKIYTPDMTFEMNVASLQSLVIGNAKAAQLKLGDRTIDLNPFIKPYSSVARLSAQDISSLQ